MLIDSHVNLHHERFAGEVDAVIAAARTAGVRGMLTISDKMESAPALRDITARYPFIWRSVGAHPHYADDHRETDARAIIEDCAAADVICIGECGLDFHYTFSEPKAQQRLFQEHITAAQETGLPLIIHTRQADDLMARMLRAAMAERPFTPLLHCFTSGLALAEEVMEMGGYISFSGIITFRNAEDVRETARRMPHDRIIIETDCPYLAPIPFRGRRCDPEHVTHVAARLAEILGLSVEETAALTTRNFFSLFKRASSEATK